MGHGHGRKGCHRGQGKENTEQGKTRQAGTEGRHGRRAGRREGRQKKGWQAMQAEPRGRVAGTRVLGK